MTPDQSMRNATLLGYVAGLAWGAAGAKRNPYVWAQAEAWEWVRGWEQGVARRIECDVRDPLPPEPVKFVAIPPPEYMSVIKKILDAAEKVVVADERLEQERRKLLQVIHTRLENGWTIERALTFPVIERPNYERRA